MFSLNSSGLSKKWDLTTSALKILHVKLLLSSAIIVKTYLNRDFESREACHIK